MKLLVSCLRKWPRGSMALPSCERLKARWSSLGRQRVERWLGCGAPVRRGLRPLVRDSPSHGKCVNNGRFSRMCGHDSPMSWRKETRRKIEKT
ncbi:hypothetical protein CRG98_021251 [Punica granatum]|uniref:Uncharacterized protein n=1 Tax=Punica granatum TaxID=22663 RepID=A0A2I0JSC4_PUNGR|nr:hypothetical protein CRG98_021251 [Punica granatum]